MNNYNQINAEILQREPCCSFEENTYYTMTLFEHFCTARDYKHVAIFGYYKSKFNWTDLEALEMYNKAPDSWTDGMGTVRHYDWGRGINKLVKDTDKDWHEPNLDHVVPKSKARLMGWTQAQIDHPSNFQVLPRKLNIILSNLTDDEAPALLPLVLAQFPNYSVS